MTVSWNGSMGAPPGAFFAVTRPTTSTMSPSSNAYPWLLTSHSLTSKNSDLPIAVVLAAETVALTNKFTPTSVPKPVLLLTELEVVP